MTTARYLWVSGGGCELLSVGQQVSAGGANPDQPPRYEVMAPRIWRDLQPETPPSVPDAVPESVLPYQLAHPLRLHVPGVYDVVVGPGRGPWLVLENAPINPRLRQLYPALQEAWPEATTVRRLSWLWQLWQLWLSLGDLGVGSSLLVPENLRVVGWRLRLCELYGDRTPPTLAQLAQSWQPLIAQMEAGFAAALTTLCQSMEQGVIDPAQLTVDLNYLLLKAATQVPLTLRIGGGTHPGPSQAQNEDACYPLGLAPSDPMPRVALVCDGVGGHAGGEVASQLVARSLQLQLQGLLAETDTPDGVVPPQIIAQQIEAAIRVANDLVNRQNDQQGRSDRQRMGTTVALGVMVPQRVRTELGWRAVNELYIAHVGDSRAYWITPDYCHLLTVDDDIAGREVQAGRQFYSALQHHPEAGALVQAVGTRTAQYLTPHIQRLVVDEEGVLLLCTDGLSDRHRVETEWANYIGLLIKDIVPLDKVIEGWIDLANQKNGHDNVAVALIHCKPRQEVQPPEPEPEMPPEEELTAASRALLYGEEEEETPVAPPPPPRQRQVTLTWVVVGAIAIVLIATGFGWWLTQRLTTPNDSPPLPATESEGE